MGTSLRRNDFRDRLGGQASLTIDCGECTRARAAKLQDPVTRVAICVSRVLLDGLQKDERLLVVYTYDWLIVALKTFERSKLTLVDANDARNHCTKACAPSPWGFRGGELHTLKRKEKVGEL